MLRHLEEVQVKLRERIEGVIIGGDFNTSQDSLQFLSEATLQNLKEAGFRNGYEGMPRQRRVTCPGKGSYADATFDYLFTKGLGAADPPIITETPVSDHYPVTRTVKSDRPR